MNAPAQVPSGMEMMIGRLLKMLGLQPEHIMVPLNQVRDSVVDADARLKRLEREVARIIKHLGVKDDDGSDPGSGQ